jgi:hypothetical protein
MVLNVVHGMERRHELDGGQHLDGNHWLHGKLYLVENVEAEVCGECGERYFHAKALDAIDRLLESKHEDIESLELEVVSLQ